MTQIFNFRTKARGCTLKPSHPTNELRPIPEVLAKESAGARVDMLGHFHSKAMEAVVNGRKSWSGMTSQEKIVVAIALNRGDWLKATGSSLTEALVAIESNLISMLPALVEKLQNSLGIDSKSLGAISKKSPRVSPNQLKLFDETETETEAEKRNANL